MKTGVIAGAFPILHPGYIELFKECKENCDKLVIFLHKDPSSERSYKKPPIFSLTERKNILLSLIYVNEVQVYSSEENLCSLLKKLSPDLRFLGEDYKDKRFTGDQLNIDIHWISRSHGWSTTKAIKSLISLYKDEY